MGCFIRLKNANPLTPNNKEEIGLLPDYFVQMQAIIEFLSSPYYINNCAKIDKKLTKNLLKRCVTEPICDRLLVQNHKISQDDIAVTELEAHYSGDSEVLKKFNRVLFALLKASSMLTPTLKDSLTGPLKVYLDFIQTRRDLA